MIKKLLDQTNNQIFLFYKLYLKSYMGGANNTPLLCKIGCSNSPYKIELINSDNKMSQRYILLFCLAQ